MKTPGRFLPRVKGADVCLFDFQGGFYLPIVLAATDAEVVDDHFSAFASRIGLLFKHCSTAAAEIS